MSSPDGLGCENSTKSNSLVSLVPMSIHKYCMRYLSQCHSTISIMNALYWPVSSTDSSWTIVHSICLKPFEAWHAKCVRLRLAKLDSKSAASSRKLLCCVSCTAPICKHVCACLSHGCSTVQTFSSFSMKAAYEWKHYISAVLLPGLA